jgi:hypothetical protein
LTQGTASDMPGCSGAKHGDGWGTYGARGLQLIERAGHGVVCGCGCVEGGGMWLCSRREVLSGVIEKLVGVIVEHAQSAA